MADDATIEDNYAGPNKAYRVIWEQQVIAGALIDQDFAQQTVAGAALSVDSFDKAMHRLIFTAMQTILGRGDVLNILTLSEYMDETFPLSQPWHQYPEFLLETLNLSNKQYVIAARILSSTGQPS